MLDLLKKNELKIVANTPCFFNGLELCTMNDKIILQLPTFKLDLDPTKEPQGNIIFISHSHADHMLRKKTPIPKLCSQETEKLVSARRNHPLINTINEELSINNLNLRMIDTGHVLGSRGLIIENEKKIVDIREKSPVRALNNEKSTLMEKVIKDVKNEKDSIGGTIKCIVKNIPTGIGRPVFNSLESNISKAIFSIPAVKGIEFGAGFKASTMKGSEHNDPWVIKNGEIQTEKNDSGGIIGGISIGMPIEFTVAIKPTATIGKPQKTVNIETMEPTEIKLTGRHDPCIVPRAVVVVEAMTAVVFLDELLIAGVIPQVLKA